MQRQFKRVNNDEWIGGVCGGLAYWLGIPVLIIRLIVLVSVFGYGVSMIPYIFLWVFAPRWDHDPEDYDEVTGG